MRYGIFLGFILFIGCRFIQEKADLLVFNAKIYTVDKDFRTAESMVIRNGKILAIGNYDSLKNKYSAENILDAGGRFIYPGFIDSHTHFLDYGFSLNHASLIGINSWAEIVDSLKRFSKSHPGGWLQGEGWDQNRWKVKEFPNKNALDSLFPDRPVLLERVDGHASLVNQAALDAAGIKPGQKYFGGEIETRNGKLTGILLDRAQRLVKEKIPKPDLNGIQEALLKAQEKCFAVGLTSVDECGLAYSLIDPIKNLDASKKLKMRIYLMLSDAPENYSFLFKNGAIKTPALHVCSFKVFADGALGSRGACLLEPYSDRPGYHGFLLDSISHYNQIASLIYKAGFQMNTHAIGDSANRIILQAYSRVLKGKNDRRWRIEHAQIVSPVDLHYFGDYSIIPSVQPTHATSDMNWAGTRLGPRRIFTAYAYRQLMNQNGWLALGTDFPVENINPLYTFYAAVSRKDLQGMPLGGFQTDNGLSREETLRGMTIWAAKANFEEKEKGSLEKGKFADFVIFDQDLMKVAENEIPTLRVWKTYSGGEKVYEKGPDKK